MDACADLRILKVKTLKAILFKRTMFNKKKKILGNGYIGAIYALRDFRNGAQTVQHFKFCTERGSCPGKPSMGIIKFRRQSHRPTDKIRYLPLYYTKVVVNYRIITLPTGKKFFLFFLCCSQNMRSCVTECMVIRAFDAQTTNQADGASIVARGCIHGFLQVHLIIPSPALAFLIESSAATSQHSWRLENMHALFPKQVWSPHFGWAALEPVRHVCGWLRRDEASQEQYGGVY